MVIPAAGRADIMPSARVSKRSNLSISYYNLDLSVCLSVYYLLRRLWTDTIIYHQCVRVKSQGGNPIGMGLVLIKKKLGPILLIHTCLVPASWIFQLTHDLPLQNVVQMTLSYVFDL